MRDLSVIFEPKSIAIIGASSNPNSVTNVTFLRQLLDFGYAGRIYPINPNAGEVLGLKAYPDLASIPERVDYVICAVPASKAPDIMRECVEAKAGVVSFFTAGFSELGDVGAQLEGELLGIARQGGVLLLGPNCLGAHCPNGGLTLDGSIARKSGHVGGISQSGGISQEIILSLAARDIYISKLISLGNAADLNECDYLEYLGQDPETKVVAMYLEGVKDPSRFTRAASTVSLRKPIVLLKGGKSPAGAGAVKLHTGSLAGSGPLWDSVCRQTGMVQVGDLKEMTDTVEAFTYLRPPRGRRVGIIGVGGGFGVLAADQCVAAGLTVPEFSPEVRADLRRCTPAVGTGLRNPVDTTPETYLSPHVTAATVGAVAKWDGVDLVMAAFPTLFGIRMGLRYLVDTSVAAVKTAGAYGKPIIIVLSTTNFAEGEIRAWELQKHLFELGTPVYFTFGQAARAAVRVIDYHETVARAAR